MALGTLATRSSAVAFAGRASLEHQFRVLRTWFSEAAQHLSEIRAVCSDKVVVRGARLILVDLSEALGELISVKQMASEPSLRQFGPVMRVGLVNNYPFTESLRRDRILGRAAQPLKPGKGVQ